MINNHLFRSVLIVLGFFLTAGAISCGPAYCLPWQELHQKAADLSKEEADAFLKTDQNTLDGLYLQGLIYFIKYDHAKAKEVFDKMLELSDQCYEAKWGLAECYRREFEVKQSLKILEQIVEKKPAFFPAYISLAYLKFNLKDYQGAANLANTVILHGEDASDTSTLTRAYLIYAGAKGMIAHNGGLISKIINGTVVFPNLKRARTLMPDSAEVLYGFGCFYYLAPKAYGGDIDKAEAFLRNAIGLDSNLIDAYVRLAQVFKYKGDMGKYDQYLNLALEKEPQNFLANDVRTNNCDFICINSGAEQ